MQIRISSFFHFSICLFIYLLFRASCLPIHLLTYSFSQRKKNKRKTYHFSSNFEKNSRTRKPITFKRLTSSGIFEPIRSSGVRSLQPMGIDIASKCMEGKGKKRGSGGLGGYIPTMQPPTRR